MKNKVSELDTSSSSSSMMPSTSVTTSTNPKGTIFVSTKDIKKPEVTKTIEKAKQNKVDIKIVEGEGATKKLKYLSEIIDEVTGDVSKPFTISGKNYQMVRAMTPDRQKVMGVCSLDDVDEMGKNVIYSIEEFEQKIAKKSLDETIPTEKSENISDSDKKDKMPSFEGYKHFIVNSKTGKARKFKNIEELAKAQMNEDEKYMSVKEFRKYVDETLFGSAKKNNVNELAKNDPLIDVQNAIKFINKNSGILTKLKYINKPKEKTQFLLFIADMIKLDLVLFNKFAKELKGVAKTNMDKSDSSASTSAPATGAPATGGQPVTENRKIIKKVKVKNIK